MKTRTWWMLGAAAVLAALALAWALAPRPVEVEAATVTQGRFEARVTEDAKTRLRERYTVSAPLAGVLERITLHEGDAVAAGAELARIRPQLSPLLDERTRREQQARIDAAQAQVQRAQSQAEAATLTLQRSRETLHRSEQLLAQGYLSPERIEADRLAADTAQKTQAATTAERQAAASALEQARAVLMTLQRPDGARPFVLRAPVAGRILRLLQTSEASVAPGMALLELGDIAQLEVVAQLLTSDALQARPGSTVRIDAGGPATLAGRVRQIEPAAFTKVSALGVEEQRVNALIDFTGPAEAWRALGDGYRVTVHIVTLAVDGAVQVPVSAVFPLPAPSAPDASPAPRMAVFVIEAGRARQVEIQLGARNGTQAWVQQGLAPGAQVIVYPGATVRDGGRVAVRKV